MLEDPQFPPLLKGTPVAPGVAASACALDALRAGKAGAGDLFWSRSEDRLNMAVVLEPDVALSKAAQMQHVMMVAFGRCLRRDISTGDFGACTLAGGHSCQWSKGW
jgi:hypothetical protein